MGFAGSKFRRMSVPYVRDLKVKLVFPNLLASVSRSGFGLQHGVAAILIDSYGLMGCATMDLREHMGRMIVVSPAFAAQMNAHRACILARGITEDEIRAGRVNSRFKSWIRLDPQGPIVKEFSVQLDPTADHGQAKVLDQCRAEANLAAVSEIKRRTTDWSSSQGSTKPVQGIDFRAEGRLYPSVSGTLSDESGLTKGKLEAL